MDSKNLKKLISIGETETVEFKENIGDSMFRTVSAFSNKRGGKIFIGIDKNGQIKGVDSSDRYLEELTNRIVDKTSIYPSIDVMNIECRRIIIIDVSVSSYPVSYEGKYYERVGNTTREMSPERLRALLLREKPWDLIASARTMADIDVEAIKTFQRHVIDSGRLKDVSLEDNPEQFLEKLEAIADHRPTNGALMLFGKDPQRHFINASIRLGRFKSETDIIDDKWARGNLFDQFDEALKQVMQHISVRYEILAIERKDIWDYPLPVLREAILNAIIHRDYRDFANFIQIKIYDDRIWISNPGGLIEGLTIGELRKPHKSHVRNPLIAKAFYLAGFIEQFGSGTIRMINDMKKAGLQEPEFKEEMGGFSIYLQKGTFVDSRFKELGLNERQIKAIDYIRENGKITNEEYQKINMIGRRQATNDLGMLIRIKLLKRKGKVGKGTFYTINKRSPNAH